MFEELEEMWTDSDIEACLDMIFENERKRIADQSIVCGVKEPAIAPSACRTFQSACDWFLEQLRASLFVNVRFYLFDKNGRPVLSDESSIAESGDRFVSVACSGLPFSVARRIEQGEITRFIDNESESSLCVQEKRPVVLQVQSDAKRPEKLTEVGVFSVYRVSDNCGSKLGREDRTYVDFPIFLDGEVFGKFSCDLCTSDLSLLSETDIFHWWTVAQKLGIGVSVGLDREQYEIVRKANALQVDWEGHFKPDAVTAALRDLLDSKTAEVTFFRGISGNCNDRNLTMKWFIECTSNTSLLHLVRDRNALENQSPLVLAVGTSQHVYRFVSIGNPDYRDGFDALFKLKIDWENDPVFGDWENADSVLAIPVFDLRDKLLGVCVITQKFDLESSGFSFWDERKAGLFLKHYMARSFESVCQARLPYLAEDSELAKKLKEKIDDAADPLDKAIELLADHCGHGSSKHFYAICIIKECKDDSSCMLIRSGGDLSYSELTSQVPLSGTITNQAVQSPEQWAYRSCERQNKWQLRSIANGAVCEGAFAFRIGNSSDVGALVIKSDCFDIEGRLGVLKYLAECLADNLASERMIESVECLIENESYICS